MKKLFLYVVLGLLWCNVGFAKDLTLYCKQEVRKIHGDGTLRKSIPHKQLWEILISDKKMKIIVPQGLTKHKYLERRKSIEDYDEFIASTGWVMTNEDGTGSVKFSQVVKINRSTGEGEVTTFTQKTSTVYDIIKCSKEKPKLLF